jgi:hypothetical protein
MEKSLDPASLATIHFPQRTTLIKQLRFASFLINDVILVASVLLLTIWLLDIPVLSTFLFEKLAFSPFIAVLFILSSLPLLFGAKRHLSGTEDVTSEVHHWWSTLIPISLATVVAVLGFINILQLNDIALLSFSRVSPLVGFYFFLIGLSLIPPFTRILHRFHYTQLLIFIVSGVSVFSVLEKTYQLFSPYPVHSVIPVPLATELSVIFFCSGILLRWSNRGFFGNFTLNSTGSMFAFRLLLVSLFAGPIMAFVVLIVMQGVLNIYQVLALTVTSFTFLSCMLLWMNVKLLYRYELEHLLMRESLRIHNIDLATEKEELQKRMTQIEQEKKSYVDKLNTQNKWREVLDTAG